MTYSKRKGYYPLAPFYPEYAPEARLMFRSRVLRFLLTTERLNKDEKSKLTHLFWWAPTPTSDDVEDWILSYPIGAHRSQARSAFRRLSEIQVEVNLDLPGDRTAIVVPEYSEGICGYHWPQLPPLLNEPYFYEELNRILHSGTKCGLSVRSLQRLRWGYIHTPGDFYFAHPIRRSQKWLQSRSGVKGYIQRIGHNLVILDNQGDFNGEDTYRVEPDGYHLACMDPIPDATLQFFDWLRSKLSPPDNNWIKPWHPVFPVRIGSRIGVTPKLLEFWVSMYGKQGAPETFAPTKPPTALTRGGDYQTYCAEAEQRRKLLGLRLAYTEEELPQVPVKLEPTPEETETERLKEEQRRKMALFYEEIERAAAEHGTRATFGVEHLADGDTNVLPD